MIGQKGSVEPVRCTWASGDVLSVAYHDQEWGVPLHDDRGLFEFLILEGAQAGLSWSTILNRRAAYREAFHEFDIDRIARLSDRALDRMLENPRLIRNRLKILSA